MRWFLCALAFAVGCSSAPPPACITSVDTNCPEGYVPTFDNVYRNTLAPTCGASWSCHSVAGNMGNLSFPTPVTAANEQTAYNQLLSPSSLDPSRKRVVPGDPSCSLMIVRTDSPGESYQMPPGVPLSAPERCALVKWVACGAPGPGSACP